MTKQRIGRKSRLIGAAGAITALGALTVQHTGAWEGLRLVAYQDVVGVWTACYGETKNIKPGMKFTKDQCNIMFIDRLQEFETNMRACLNDPDGIPGKSYVAFLSLSYNIGSHAFCHSTAARRANAGNIEGACHAIRSWNKAGRPLRVVKGLDNRRRDEEKLCLEGANEG